MTSKRGMLLCNLARQGMNALPSKNQEEEHFEVSDKVCEVVPNQDIGQHNNNDLKVLQWFKDNPEIDYIEETIEQIETINMDIVEEVIGTVKETAVDNVNDANITEEILLYQLGSNNREDSEKDETDFSGTNSDRDKDFVPDKRKKRKLVTSLNSSTSCSSSSSSTTSSSSSTSSSSDSESTKSTNLPSTSNQINAQLLDDQPSSSAHRIATQDSNDEVNIMEVRPQLECEFQNMPVTTKSKKKCRNPAAWKQNIRKALKNTGQEHTNSSGKIIPAKKIGPPCSEKCLISCSKRISIAERQELFTGYWELGSLTRQRDYVASCISTLAPEYRRLKSEPKFARKPNSCFYLPLNGDKIRVCKTFFLNTLAITTRFLRHIINIRTTTGTLPPDKRGTLTKKRIDTEMHESVRAHINSIPRIESHYLSAQTTRQYIDGQYTVADLHRLYCEYRKENNKPCATYDFYYRVFKQEFNISFFTPKKDQCDQCVSYNNLSKAEQSLKEDEYRLHLKEKTLSREEKQADMRLLKEEGHENLIVAIYDLQAVLPVPIGNSSAFFYKSKLNCYNFTVTDFKEKKTSCFFWHEGLGNRGVNEIGSCVYLYLQELARKHPNCDVIFYSDNCCGQQKNKFMINLYYYAVNTLAINTIQHKFLIRGHTQSEADSVHSVIEKAVKRAKKSGPIYVPDQYCQLIRSAKKTGNPFFVKEMNFSDFYDLKCLTEDNNLNINKAKNGRIIKILEIRQLKFIKGNVYYFKTSYEGEWIEVERNHTVTRSTRVHQPQEVALKQAYACKMPLAARKKADIQSLIDTNIIPKVYECIYNTIF